MHHKYKQTDGKHPLVKSFEKFYDGLEAIVGKENIDLEKYVHVNTGLNKPEYEFLGSYDGNKAKIAARDSAHKQTFSVTITAENAGAVQEYLKEHDAL